MTSSPKTSVIIPVYNTRDYLPACLDSVLGQTQREIEVILVDDGSTDGSLEIEMAYAARDDRVRVIEQPNLRQGTARNAGLRVARGEFVYFMDSDDLIVPTLFEECYAACQADSLDFATFDSAGFLDDPDEERPELFTEIRDRQALAPMDICDGPTFWTALFCRGAVPFVCWLEYFRRDFLLENQLEFVEGIYFEDNDWVVRVFLAAKRLRYLPRKLHRYRERPGSNVHSGFKQVLAESCFDIHFDLIGLYWRQKTEARKQMVLDVGNVVGDRFAQFDELEPSEDFIERTAEFARRLVDCIGSCDGGQRAQELNWHLSVLLRLAKGVHVWERDVLPAVFTPDYVLRALFGNAWEGACPTRVGVYGTGKVCRLLGDALADCLHPVAYFQTDDPAGKAMFGLPVRTIREASASELDIMLVASTRFRDEMISAARDAVGPTVPVETVLRAVLYLENWPCPRQWGGGYGG